MINLMPTLDQKELAAARTNTLLLRYVALVGLFIVLLILEIGIVYAILNNDKANNEAAIAENQLKTASYATTKQQADEFRSNLATAKYILSKQASYSSLILAIANNLPGGAVLDSLTLSPTTFGTSTTLSVRTVSYDKSIEVKNALQNAKMNGAPIFTSVSFASVSASDTSTDSYKFNAIYNIVYSKALLQQ